MEFGFWENDLYYHVTHNNNDIIINAINSELGLSWFQTIDYNEYIGTDNSNLTGKWLLEILENHSKGENEIALFFPSNVDDIHQITLTIYVSTCTEGDTLVLERDDSSKSRIRSDILQKNHKSLTNQIQELRRMVDDQQKQIQKLIAEKSFD